jgi:hypothetical protein
MSRDYLNWENQQLKCEGTKMIKTKPNYTVVNEFNGLASQIIAKYPKIFYEDVHKIRLVKATNKSFRKGIRFELMAVKMPSLMDSPYAWYVTVSVDDWNTYSEAVKLAVVAEILSAIPMI